MPDRQTVYEFLLLVVLVSALTFAAAWIFPIWDDGRLMLAIQEFGSAAIWTNFGNRPLAALFYSFLLNHNLFVPVAVVLHFVGWLGMGWVTRSFWRLSFPSYANVALLPAILSVAPILCKMQTVLLTLVTIDLVPPLLVFAALFILLRQYRQRWHKLLLGALAFALIVVAVLISEYSVVAAAVAMVFLAGNAARGTPERKGEFRVTAGLIAACAVVSYGVFLWLTKGSGRDAFRPSYIKESFSLRIPFRLLSGIWRGILGGLLQSLGSITLHSKVALLSFVCGCVFSLLVVLVLRKQSVEVKLDRDKRVVITLFAATVLALIPVVLMDRTLESRWDSRFWLPALPVLSCLSVYLLLYLVRSRLQLLVVIVCGFLGGYWTTSEVANALRNGETVATLVQEVPGQEFYPRISKHTVNIVHGETR